MAEPRYTVRAIKFHCVDESGIDWTGSDEPFWVFTANDEATAGVNSVGSKIFGNVDSGDTERFESADNRNIVWPQSRSADGAEAPIGLSIQLWEKDQGNRDKIVEATEKAFDIAGFVPVVGQWIAKVPSVVQNAIAGFAGDDLMGSATIGYTASRLAQRLPNVGDTLTEKFRLGSRSGDIPFGLGGAPDYDLYLEIQRVA